MTLDALDRKLIARLCGDIGDSLHPWRQIADETGISEDEVLSKLKEYKEEGMLRRVGAILRHRSAGFSANGMSAWNVPADDIERVGELMASVPEISHCYERPSLPDWPYNIYAMIHGTSEDEIRAVANKIAEETGIEDYEILFSGREFKKSSVQFFAEEARRNEHY